MHSNLISTSLREALQMLSALLHGFYPKFIIKNGFVGQEPVFFYHHIDETTFDTHLNHLRRNGYYTLTADEYCQLLLEDTHVDPKAVVLTFDDGLENLFAVAYPLLKKYEFKAIAFIMPEWIGKKAMITWDQAKEVVARLGGASLSIWTSVLTQIVKQNLGVSD